MKIKLPKRDKTAVKTYKQTVVNAVILVVVLVLFLYFAIQLSRGFSTQVSTQRTQKITDISYSYLDGFIFKDGESLSWEGDIIHYLVSDGEKVGVGQAYAEIYSNTLIPTDEQAAFQDRLNELSDRIGIVERGIEGQKNVSALGEISDEIASSYYAYIDAVLGGSLYSADKTGEVLLGSLIDYSSITLSEEAGNTLSALISEREELIASIGGTKKTLISEKSFTFYRESDGYDKVFASSRLGEMSRAELDAIVNESVGENYGEASSRVFSSKWYLAIPTGSAGYVTFSQSVGSTYEIEFLGSHSLSLSMILEAAVADGEDTESSYLLFSSHDLARSAGLDRQQDVRVVLESTTGYRVPSGALHTVNEETGVYILVGNMIEFRRVALIGEGEGYYIVNTYENDLQEGSLSSTPYLGVNDLIITSGRDLYDGKLLD